MSVIETLEQVVNTSKAKGKEIKETIVNKPKTVTVKDVLQEVDALKVELGNLKGEIILLKEEIKYLKAGSSKPTSGFNVSTSKPTYGEKCPICYKPKQNCTGHRLCKECHAPEGKPHAPSCSFRK